MSPTCLDQRIWIVQSSIIRQFFKGRRNDRDNAPAFCYWVKALIEFVFEIILTVDEKSGYLFKRYKILLQKVT